MRTLVSTNSALMQLFPRPTNDSTGLSVGRILNSDEETALGLGCLSILVHQAADRFRHQTGHRLIVGGGINPESPEQGFGETERDILVGAGAHIFKCIKEICARVQTEGLASLNKFKENF